MRYLIERNEIDYDAHAALLYKLAGQVVARVRSYLADDAEVENVLLRHGRQLAEFIFAQMMNHYRETPLGEDDYEVTVTRGFIAASSAADERARTASASATSSRPSRRCPTRASTSSAASRSAAIRSRSSTPTPSAGLPSSSTATPATEKWIKPGPQSVPHRLSLRGSL